MLKEFKEFIAKGNVFELAVGIVIGAAFGAVVTSLVEDVVMPPVGMLLGGVDFGSLYVNLSGEEYASLAEAVEAGAPVIKYGAFLNNVISFLIVAFVVFLLVKGYNRMRAQQESAPAAPTTKDCPFCIYSIPITATRCPHCTSQLANS